MFLTNSEIACYQRCPTEWQYRYVEHRTGPSTAAQSRGARIHAWLAWWWLRCQGIEPFQSYEPVELAMLAGYANRWTRPTLVDVRVNVPFAVALDSGVTLVGEIDALGADEFGNTIVVEHKSTTQDVSPGSKYWSERVSCDPQVSTYLTAFPNAAVLYDVLRVPALRPLEANTRRKSDETSEEYVARCVAAMAEKPDYYFQHATIVRLEHEHAAFERDVELVAEAMVPQVQPRNPKACFSFGHRCDFFDVCWAGKSIDTLERLDRNHTEQMADKIKLDVAK